MPENRRSFFLVFALLVIWTMLIGVFFAWNEQERRSQTAATGTPNGGEGGETAAVCGVPAAAALPKVLVVSHVLLWGFGTAGIVFVAWGIKRRTALILCAEKDLRKSEARYRLLFENASHGIGYYDIEGNAIALNMEAAARLDGKPGDFVGKSVGELYGEDVGRAYLSRIDIAVNQTGSQTYEYEIELPVGRYWLLATFTRIYDDCGTIVGVQVISVNVTQRKIAELALQESEERFRALVEAVPLAIFLVRDNKLIYGNPASARLFGEESLQQFERQGAAKTFGKNLQEIFKSHKTIGEHPNSGDVGEVQVVGSDGKTVCLSINCVSVQMKGVETGIIVARDMTRQKLAEAEIKKFRTISDNALHGNVIFDFDGKVLYANECFARIFGYDTSEIKQLSISELWRPEEVADFQASKGRYIVEGGMPPTEITGRHRKGDDIPVLASAIVLRNEVHQQQYFAGAVIDVTERKRLERQLQQAQKMESLGNFVGGIAHDFNNLLFPIVGISEMLLDVLAEGSAEREHVREILNAGMRGSSLVKQILAFSRQSERQLMPVRIQDIITEVIKLSRRTIPANIEIEQDIQMTCGLVMADAVQIHQVAMNLINNAFHAVEEKNGSIIVHLTETLSPDVQRERPSGKGRYVQISVTDNGQGISDAVRERMFDPYFTTKPQGKGTGLGLSVAYGIVKEHGGEIEVRSEPGKGAAFHVYLPVMEKYFESKPVDVPVEHYPDNIRILLVDDELANVNIGQRMLESLGYQVTARTSSVEALELFRKKPGAFDLVVTDMSMPNMTGEKLSEALVSLRPDLPVIICTGFSERMSRETAEAIGIKGFLMKPIVRSDMAKMIRKVLCESEAG